MGSTGSGTLSDYQGYKSNSNSNQGGSSGEDKCGKAFSTSLEEVSNCDYFLNNGNVPTIGTPVTIVFGNLRIEVKDGNNDTIGYLPTKFNYLRLCINDGQNYEGLVSNSGLVPLPNVVVDITPI